MHRHNIEGEREKINPAEPSLHLQPFLPSLLLQQLMSVVRSSPLSEKVIVGLSMVVRIKPARCPESGKFLAVLSLATLQHAGEKWGGEMAHGL